MKFIPQKDKMDCGPACIAMVCNHYKKKYPIEFIREHTSITREGVSLYAMSRFTIDIGFETETLELNYVELCRNISFSPIILYWNKNHFVVLDKITKNILSERKIHIIDPAHGKIKLSENEFKKSWINNMDKGIALFLNPKKEFFTRKTPKKKNISISYLLNYLRPYIKQVSYMFFLLLCGSFLTLIFPFLTQNLIDKGVIVKNLSFIKLILLAQLGVFFGSITIEIFRNHLMLFLGTKLSIKIISDFLKKMLQLPIVFFDTKTMGDFNQRIQDNERIEKFLTSESLLTFFSLITFSVFFGVLWYYDFKILIIYLIITVLSIIWSLFWLKKIKNLDYHRFQQRSENQESIYEILNGVTEMKINNFEDYKLNEWKGIQNKLFKINIRILKLNQLQLSGFEFLNQFKNIIVTFLASYYVVEESMTLGVLLSISYIIGQMNSPVNQLVNFFRSLQDAKLSLERLNEVQNQPNEDELLIENHLKKTAKNNASKSILMKNVFFKYHSVSSLYILNNINICLKENTVTAVVGASGSGKTTLMKLLLKFYNPTQGEIMYNDKNILGLSSKKLRQNCGVVMQDGYVFSDTIERNIAMGDENINYTKLKQALNVACIDEFVESLPLGLKTKIGSAGNGISGGQRQRILIARAVYKNPKYILLDEATSALDAENEKKIHDNLQTFFKGKTVLVIAHRLSTVKKADNIIVLEKGEIVEQGKHKELVAKKGKYYSLIKNQLELGD